jgi:hypothetical protein
MALVIGYNNLADNALISTAAASIATLPPSNLRDVDIQKIWRSSSLSSDALIIDLGSQPQTIGVVALINCNLTTTSVVRVRISNSDSTGQTGTLYDSGSMDAGVDPIYSIFLDFVEPQVVGRYVRIDLNVANAQAGRLVVAPRWLPSHHFQFGWEQATRDYSRHALSIGFNEVIDRQKRQRAWRFRLFGLSVSEANNDLEYINRVAGTSQDILVCRDSTSTNLGKFTLWGLLDDALAVSQISETTMFTTEFTIRERL